MKRIVLSSLFLIISVFSFSQNIFYETINYQGIEREYIIHIPSSYTAKIDSVKSIFKVESVDDIKKLNVLSTFFPIVNSIKAPLILCFHGYSSSANIIMSYSGFNELSEKEGFIIVYPQGKIYKKSGKTHWNVGYTPESQIDDIEFTNRLLDNLLNKYLINKDRIYSTGFSNGGYMSFLLACQLSDRFAAISSVAGSMTPSTFKECNPQHSTPILQVHGLKDRVVPYIGKNSWTKPVKDVVNYWAKFNNCDTIPIVKSLPNTVKYDSSYLILETYNNGTNEVSTQHIKIINGGHEWPGIKENFNIKKNEATHKFISKYAIRGNMDINVCEEIWKFFNQYNINGKIGDQ